MNSVIYECHCHIALDGSDFKNAAARHKNGPDRQYVENILEQYQDAGIPYIRDGGDKWGVSRLAKEIAPDYGLEYATPVFPIYKKDNYGSFIGEGFETMSDFRALVARAKTEGADFIKIMGSGIMDFNQYAVLSGFVLTGPEIREMITIAHGEGFPVMLHMNSCEGVKWAVEAGADSIEHGNYLDRSALAMLAESECVWVPTLTPTVKAMESGAFNAQGIKEVFDMQQGNVALGNAFYVPIAAGSDAGAQNVPHVQSIMDEASRLAKLLGSWSPVLYGQEKLREKFKG